MATEELQRLRHAGEQTGVEVNTQDMGLQRMTRRVAEAAVGTGEAKAAIAEMGLDAGKLAAMTPGAAFAEIADAMKKVKSQSDRVRLAFKLFDSEGVAIVNTLALGKDGLAAMGKEADKLGISFSRIEAAKIEAANDAIDRMKKAFSGVGNQLAIKVAPAVESIAKWIEDAATKTDLLATSAKYTVGYFHETNCAVLKIGATIAEATAKVLEFGDAIVHASKVAAQGWEDVLDKPWFGKGSWGPPKPTPVKYEPTLSKSARFNATAWQKTAAVARRATDKFWSTPIEAKSVSPPKAKTEPSLQSKFTKEVKGIGGAILGAGKDIVSAFGRASKWSTPIVKHLLFPPQREQKTAPKKDTSFAFAQTAMRGSLEAYQTIARYSHGNAADPKLQEQKKTTKELQKIEYNTRSRNDLAVLETATIPV